VRGVRILLALVLPAAPPAAAQLLEGELRIRVSDPDRRPVAGAAATLESSTPRFAATARTNADGAAHLTRVPVGRQRLTIRRDGFDVWSAEVETRSAIPQEIAVTLRVEAVRASVTVSAPVPLLDPRQPTLAMQAGREQFEETAGTTLGRDLVDVITTMPGWLLEAGAVLHPRGSEYDTQYVVDGMPVYDNRSIAFAPAFGTGEFEQVSVLTAGIPAEYGRRLGGVIALDTRRQGRLGHSSEAAYHRGTYATLAGMAAHGYRSERLAASMRVHGGWTDRYLDPPSLENFTNRGSSGGVDARLDRDLGPADRINLYFRSNGTGFLVPNDPEQEEEGQRQDRRSGESSGQIHYQHTFSARAIGTVRGMVRDLSARLWSNPLATPVHVDQDRGFREGAVIAAASVEGEHHTLKFGGDIRAASLRERFVLGEPDEYPEPDIDFRATRRNTASSVFAQDAIRWGNFAANLGVRADRFSLIETENAISPRVAASYFVPKANLLIRGAYDRVFQPAPIENILLSSAAARLEIEGVEGSVPVPASRGDFFEVGFRQGIGNRLRIDATHFWRRFRNYSDDDVFFNTGIGFPIAFDRAEIEGTEVRLELPRWRGVSGFASYSNMTGRARSPVTGGLFLEGGEAEELRGVATGFPITQDQRNTFAGQVRVEPWRRVWASAGLRYGSGLPFEAAGDDDDDDGEAEEIPAVILERIDLARGRIRPNSSLNVSAGVRVTEGDRHAVSLQVDVRNVTDRLNILNFSGLFSGTAIAPGRQVTFQLRVGF
jgi:hypothetical protein